MRHSSNAFDLPRALRADLETAAAEEDRPPNELLCDAVERYLSERRRFRGDTIHAEILRGLESLRQGNGLDGEAVMAELLAELDTPHHAG